MEHDQAIVTPSEEHGVVIVVYMGVHFSDYWYVEEDIV